ncbi:MAG: cell division protein ZipA [Gammaproteobacteria bacterium]|nr:cell division protein ZipA [Gammaproteobacteria bacterium]
MAELSLRTLLLIIGAVIVLAVGLFTAWKLRRDTRLSIDRHLGRVEGPDAGARHAGDDSGDLPRTGGRGEGFDEIIAVRTLPPDEVPPLKPAPRRGLVGKARAAAEKLAAEAEAQRIAALTPPDTPPVFTALPDLEPDHEPTIAPQASAPPPTAPVEAPPLVALEPEPPVARLELPGKVVLPPQDQALADLPAVRNDIAPPPEPSNARKRLDQLDLFGDPPPTPVQDPPAVKRRTYREPPKEPENGLITLYVRAHDGQQFSGTTLVKALNAVGLQHGDMAIFHHYGAGELKCKTPVFSAANMFEPGTFDLRRIEAFRTAGVALFLQLPGPLDGPVAFELLLNTAQRLTELTGGELYADPKSSLDPPAIARLRKRAASFSHARV